jgi:rod shape-determining protein MreC
VVSEDILIGYLAEVNLTSSRVSLITNPNSAVPVLMQESRASGLVRGAIGYGLVLEDVTKDSPLKEGENIITSGLGGQYPRGLLVGKLEKVISSPADLFQKASVKMLIEIEKLERVFVISEE